jgi:hypothetical protein
LNWTIQDYYHKDVDPQEYLLYLKHGINFLKKFNLQRSPLAVRQATFSL